MPLFKLLILTQQFLISSDISVNSKFPDILKHFDEASFAAPPNLVDCTLSEGTKIQCLSITIQPQPASFEIGPWCPRNISDGPDVSGIWLNDGKVYAADGQFIRNLSTFYKDSAWQLFDPETGAINVTDSEVSCRAAARRNVALEYQNHCVECQVSYLDEGTYQTFFIPIEPINATKVSGRVGHDGVGVAHSG